MMRTWTDDFKLIIMTIAIAFWVGLLLGLLIAAPAHAQIHAEVNRVQVPVTVLEKQGVDGGYRLAFGLQSSNFRIWEDGVEQEILSFSTDDTPVSVGFVFDQSGSMKERGKTEVSRAALAAFVAESNKADEFFLVTFSDTAMIAQDWTTGDQVLAPLTIAPEQQKRTALLDAFYLAIQHMRSAKNSRKIIFLITDGGDNHSRYSVNDIKHALHESDIQLYGVGIFNHTVEEITHGILQDMSREETLGPLVMQELTDMTGGLTFDLSPNDPNLGLELKGLAVAVSQAIRSQYIITYKPLASKMHDGKRHKIKVRVKGPRGSGIMIPYTREAYTSPGV